MKLYGLKNCDTCRKALKTLDSAVLIDVREAPLDDALLTRALEQFAEKLVNTRSTTWRGLSAEDRARPPFDLLRDHPALMKRPLIETADGELFLGWTRDVQVSLGIVD
ncbi:ArsC/Spx/MgsR family protein [Thalassovita sp.]|uniref:ArsC/Spx/MgsR family protein n=1 Tax=Thalassovita sp. TaxID=1979401 RepID=UPI002880D364|nr:ArsC/Spx/MgsR family protein [Thalassovita sp.]MDF1801859.1 arsenate reductase [Thalassovita sp.]